MLKITASTLDDTEILILKSLPFQKTYNQARTTFNTDIKFLLRICAKPIRI